MRLAGWERKLVTKASEQIGKAVAQQVVPDRPVVAKFAHVASLDTARAPRPPTARTGCADEVGKVLPAMPAARQEGERVAALLNTPPENQLIGESVTMHK